MEDISDIFEKLRISLAGDERPNGDGNLLPVQSLIERTIKALKETEETIPEDKIQEILPFVKTHLQGNDLTMMASLLEFIAELSKSENLRQECVDAGIIPCVLNCLDKENPSITLQALRAIGNISCDNNKAREQILEAGGVEKIVIKLKEIHDFNEKVKNEDNRFHITACGSVLNISLDNEELQKEVVKFGAIPILLGYVENNLDKTDLCLMATNAVSCLSELDEGCSSFIASRGCRIFAIGLKNSTGKQSVAIGECLMALSEQDDIKKALVQENCVDILQEIISTNMACSSEDKDLIQKLRVAVDLIILLLGDDHCLDLLFAEENNAFIDKILLWNHSNQAYIRNSGPVAIGNIARTETNCIKLVKMDVHKYLIDLLCNTTGGSEKDEIQLYVAVFNAMKNLAIPESNKPVLIASGALDCTLKFLSSSETPLPLALKAISVTRLLVQGQASAVDTVCGQDSCISNVVSLAQNCGIERLKSEASRLLATLLKNARTSDAILSVVRNNGLVPVASMITSSHSIMQNEALVGIALTVNVMDNELAEKIDESNLLTNINNILGIENPEPQTSYNSMAVIEALFLKGLVEKNKLEDCGILDNLEKLINHEHQTIGQRASTVLNKIKNPKT